MNALELNFTGWYNVQEGNRWNAVKHGVKAGFKAYSKKRKQDKSKKEKANLESKILTAKSDKDFERVADELLDKGYDLKPAKFNSFHQWMIEMKL